MSVSRYAVVLFLSFFLSVAAFSPVAFAQEEERMAGSTAEKTGKEYDTYRQLNLFGDVFERVRAGYVDEVSDEELVETAISGMLSSLDPHSSYLDEDDFTEMQVQTRGEFGGLGIEVTMENGLVKVVSPIDDTPAFRAGVQAGDYITNLDGETVMGLSLSEAVDKMRGKVGTAIDLTVRRKDVPDPIEITIVRDVIKIRAVRSEIIDNNIGYIRITTFNQNTMSGVEEAVKNFKKEMGDGIVGYIIDLRNNPGGLLDQAIAVADAFLDRGEIVSTRGRHEEDTKRDNATPGDIIDGLPIVVLINGGSASASEIVAGALQDHRRAILMGTRSFGKGSVQTVIPLPGHGAMRLTTARYYTPSGRSIQAKGIEPDITVELAKIETIKTRGMHEADLRGALENPDGGQAKKPAGDDAKAANDNEGASEDSDEIQDYQKSRAIDLIRGLSLYGDRILEVMKDKSADEKTANVESDAAEKK